MFIKKLRLENFRNYKTLDLSFSKDFNIIYGDNGQGKTNIIESIFMCASGRSHRTSKDFELILIPEKFSSIGIELFKGNDNRLIEIFLKKDEKKKILINEIPVKRVGDLMGNLNAVIFSPEDLMIIKEGPSLRRRFIDITISQLRPSYFFDLQQYLKILSQRNALLKQAQQNQSALKTIDVWNYNLAATGARIIKNRLLFTEKLSRISEHKHSMITEGKEKLKITYSPSIKIDAYSDVKQIENVFLKTLEESQEREIFKASTLHGPQRDDMELFLNGMNLRFYGSQGQQRTSVLSMKMSEIEIMKEETGEYPVLLLDDVMSELDLGRQQFLYKSLEDVQTFITCTDKSFFIENDVKDASFFWISKGMVLEDS